jgi:collagenase-like PrtC family protease
MHSGLSTVSMGLGVMEQALYSSYTLTRWHMPVELSTSVLAEFRKEMPANVEIEAFGWPFVKIILCSQA